jgi:diguanylate cyclase (GGDEF)-like protein
MLAGAQEIASTAPSLSVDPRAFAGATAILVAGLLLLLYFYRRRRYILFWAAGWTLTALSMLLASQTIRNSDVAAFARGASQFLGIVGALVFVVSADAYRSRPRIRRGHTIGLLPILIWFTLTPLAIDTFDPVFAPGHLLIGGALGAAGIAHLGLLREIRLLGALLCGCMMLVTAAAHLWIAYTVASPTSAAVTEVMLLITIVFILTALGMQLMTFEDMTYELRVTNRRLESAQSELRQLVTTDALTGCRNRRYFDEVIGRELQRHRRYGVPLSIMFIDVDRFKAVNDTLGHEAGDRVLQTVAGFLTRHVREADYVFRWGGDEFLILISCPEAQALRKAQELRRAFALSEDTGTLPEGVGLSIGCVEVPIDTSDIVPLLKLADERMYQAKRAEDGGGNRR